MDDLLFDVYGRFRLRVERRAGEWVAEHATTDGKRKRLADVVIPPEATPDEIIDILEVAFHEVGRVGARIRLVPQ